MGNDGPDKETVKSAVKFFGLFVLLVAILLVAQGDIPADSLGPIADSVGEAVSW